MKEVKNQRKEVMVKTGYRIPAELKAAIEKLAVQERRSTNDQVIILLERGLKAEVKDGL